MDKRSSASSPKRIIVGMTGASGVIYGIRLIENLSKLGVEIHLVVTPAAKVTITAETEYKVASVEKLAKRVYRINDIAAPISSGSFPIDAMVIIPCTMHTLGALASGTAENLLIRAAEVTMKEQRRLIVVPRETPMSTIHLENMAKVSAAGVVVVPAMPAFYQKPKTIDDMVDHIVGRILDLLGFEENLFERWKGLEKESQ